MTELPPPRDGRTGARSHPGGNIAATHTAATEPNPISGQTRRLKGMRTFRSRGSVLGPGHPVRVVQVDELEPVTLEVGV
jgi:hypothetical protein